MALTENYTSFSLYHLLSHATHRFPNTPHIFLPPHPPTLCRSRVVATRQACAPTLTDRKVVQREPSALTPIRRRRERSESGIFGVLAWPVLHQTVNVRSVSENLTYIDIHPATELWSCKLSVAGHLMGACVPLPQEELESRNRSHCVDLLVLYCPTVTSPLFATYFQEKWGGGGGRNNKDLCFRLAVKPPPPPHEYAY